MNIRFKTTLAWAALLVSCSNMPALVNDNVANSTTLPKVMSFELPTQKR